MENIEEFMIEVEQEPLTSLSIDNIINEDRINNSLKIYDENIFKNSPIFKISLANENEEELEEEEKRIKKKKKQKRI